MEPKKTRGELLLKALELIGETALGTGHFVSAFLASNKSNYRLLRYGPDLRPKFQNPAAQERQRFYDLLYRLERDNLIARAANTKRTIWKLTPQGKMKRQNLLSRFNLKFPHHHYQKETTETVTIISFDVPERERRKRSWLRAVLTNLNFRMLQKSVWIGKVKIPKQFLEDLRRLRLTAHVEIFTINKQGSIRHII